jgi:protein TonB
MAMTPTTTFMQPATSANDSLLVALFIAAVLHVFILIGINFTIPKPEKINKPIEITLANTVAKKAPKKASHLAQDNQMGGGKKTQKPTPPQKKLPSQGHSNQKKPAPRPVKSTQKEPVKKVQKVLTQPQAPTQIAVTEEPEKVAPKPQPKLSAEDLAQQIAQLGAEIRHKQKSSEQSKIKFINSVSTHQYIAAQYMKDWEDKVERTGNLNYPEVARKKGFSATLRMDVGINPDGSIYSIRMTQSSSNPALDDAAKRIVQLSAPFAALPQELLEELDVLIIPRVWKFSDESGISAR